MAQPTVCVLDNIIESMIDGIQGMNTDNYFFNYDCTEHNEKLDLNKFDKTKFIVGLSPVDQYQLQDQGAFVDRLELDLLIYTISSSDDYIKVLNKVDQDFKKLLGTTHFKISCGYVRSIKRESFKRYFVPDYSNRYGFAVLRLLVDFGQDVIDPQVAV